MRTSRILAPILAILALFQGGGSALAQDETCRIADSAISDASTIRNLRIKRPVPCYVHGKEQVKKYLLHAIETKIPAEKLRMEEAVYKALGFFPENFDYEKGIVELYLNQIGGYYDPDKSHFIMAGWLPAMLQTTVAVHELTHALQDQYFDLSTFMDEKKLNGDELLARSALVEGDATAVMLDYARKMAGVPGIEKEDNVEAMMLQNVVSSSLVAGMGAVPQSMQMLLIFPYTSGLRFAHTLLRRGAYAEIDAAFRRPPRSTEEILHPEKYLLEKPDFVAFQGKDLAGAEAGKLRYEDTMGEFATSLLLGNFTSEKASAAKAAAGWGGDRVAVFEDGSSSYRRIVWKTNWDSTEDAEEFFEAYSAALSTKYSGLKVEPQRAITVDGAVALGRAGSHVVLTIRQKIS